MLQTMGKAANIGAGCPGGRPGLLGEAHGYGVGRMRREQRLKPGVGIGPQAGRTGSLRLLPHRLHDDSRHRRVKAAECLGLWWANTVRG